MLNILERYDLKADGPRSPRTLHRVTEAMRRGFFTRATAIADPDVVDVPVARLDLQGLRRRARPRRSRDRATPSVRARARSRPRRAEGDRHDPPLDDRRRGQRRRADLHPRRRLWLEGGRRRRGFLLNNEMGDFNLIPGRTDTPGRIGTPANLIAPGKRMLSSQAPTIVLEEGRVRLVTGSPGGRTIPSTTLCGLAERLWSSASTQGSGRCPADPSPLAPRHLDPRRPLLADRDPRRPRGSGP